MPVNELKQLLVGSLGSSLAAAAQRLRYAVLQMILHQAPRHAAQRLLNGSNLHDDVGAVAIFFDHFLQAANLPFDAAKPMAIRAFYFGINSCGFALMSQGACFTRIRRTRIRRSTDRRRAHYIYPPTLYWIREVRPESQVAPDNDATAACGACYNACAMTLVETTYELQTRLTEEQLRDLGEFANTYGLRRFRLDEAKNELSFEYDASRLRETQVEHVLGQAKIAVRRRVN